RGTCKDHSPDRAIRLFRPVHPSDRPCRRRRSCRRARRISRHDGTLDRGCPAMKLEIDGRVALVSGASRGIGLAIARALAAEGARMALAARGLAGLEAATKEINGESSVHAADVTDPAAAATLARDVEQRWGRVDILICNAGSGASVPPGTETAAEW